MKYLFTLLLGFALAGSAPAQMMQAITNDVHHSSGGGAVATLVQKVTSPTCGNATTCSGTITAIGAGHALIFLSQALATGIVMSSINTGGTLVACGGGALNTGGNINGTIATSFQCGWVLSTTSSTTTMTVTYGATTTGAAWTMYEYACSGGTVSHDDDKAIANSIDTTPFNGATLTITGTNDFILVGGDGNNTDPTSITGYGDFLGGGLGLGTGDLLNTTNGTAASFVAPANTGGKIANAVAMKCQ